MTTLATFEERDFAPAARWTPDCNGKQDFDGGIISVSTRYWPDFSACASIRLDLGPPAPPSPPDHIPYHPVPGDSLAITEKWFTGASEADVKANVENWVAHEGRRILRVLKALYA